MTKASTHITGIPYFPGVTVGGLHKGTNGEGAERILLITQNEVTSIKGIPAGIIVSKAAPFSHTMIGLLGLGVPTVLVSATQAATLSEGTRLVIDGDRGLITDDLTTESLTNEGLPSIPPGQAVRMADAEPVNLLASVRKASAADRARALGASRIGLVRSEFVMPGNGQVPDHAFYLKAFREICEAAAPLSVTFRLLDVAADKVPPWLASIDAIGQSLGMQGVRIYHVEPVQTVIEAQLNALAALSDTYSIRVLLPFLVRLEEFNYWYKQVRQYLSVDVPIGAMAETPAMALDIGHLLESADFVAIGCNDLMQSLFAADRDRPEFRYYLDPYAPVLYRLFKQVAEQAGDRLSRIQLCGVLAQTQGVLPVLLGLGYRNFSVDATFIPHLAKQISILTQANCETLASQVVTAETTQQVLQILGLELERHQPFMI